MPGQSGRSSIEQYEREPRGVQPQMGAQYDDEIAAEDEEQRERLATWSEVLP